MLVCLSGEANQVAGIVVAKYLSLVPLWLERFVTFKRKCLYVVGLEEIAEGKDLAMDWINLGRNSQIQMKTDRKSVV